MIEGVAALFARIESTWKSLSHKGRDRFSFCAFLGVLLLVTCAMYWRFIFCDDLLVFAGSGSDSIGQTVPFIVNEAERIQSGDFSIWNQYQFLGSVTAQHLSPDYLPMVFGPDAVPVMMLVSQMLKIVSAGVFFYLFTGYLGVSRISRYVAGLGCAFCARMIALAPWTFYTLEVVIVAALLWGFERFYADNKKIAVLPFAIAAPALGGGVYPFVLYLLVLLGYAVFRVGYSWDSGWGGRRLAAFSGKFLLLVAAGMLLSLPALIPGLSMLLNSPRVENDLDSGFGLASLLVPSDWTMLAEEVVKLFSTSILGTMQTFSGSTNILNTPYFYCGLLVLMGLPFAFFGKTKRQKIWLGVIVFAAAFYFLSWGFRYLLNGFSVPGDDFRQSSCWVIAVLLFVGILGLDQLVKKVSRPLLVVWWGGALLAVFAVFAFLISDEINWTYFVLASAFLVAYVVVFAVFGLSKSRRLMAACLVFVMVAVPCEFFIQNYKMVTQATHLTRDDYWVQLGTDPEDSVTAVSSEQEDTYRIDYKTALLTRSMAETYLGTQAYIGGSGPSQQVTDFLSEVGNDYVEELGYSRYAYGFYDSALNALLGVKYLVYPSSSPDLYEPFGYREVSDDGVYRVLENEYALPLMFGYDANEVISESDFSSVDRADRGLQMLKTAVLPDDTGGSSGEGILLQPSGSDEPVSLAQTDLEATKENQVHLDFPSTAEEYLELSMRLDATPSESGNVTIDAVFSDSETGQKERVSYYTAAGEEDISVQLKNRGYDQLDVAIVATNACDDPVVEEINVRPYSNEEIVQFDRMIDNRLSSSSEVESYHNGILKGSIDMDEDGYLATSIPWNESWRIFVDGEEVEPMLINLGFLGAPLSQGEHEIELVYDRASLMLGYASFFGVSILIAVICAGNAVARRQTGLSRRRQG